MRSLIALCSGFVAVLAIDPAATTKKTKTPELRMETPIQRRIDSAAGIVPQLGEQPCGGVPNGFVHYHAMPGSRNIVGWRVDSPSNSGNCTVRIGDVPMKPSS